MCLLAPTPMSVSSPTTPRHNTSHTYAKVMQKDRRMKITTNLPAPQSMSELRVPTREEARSISPKRRKGATPTRHELALRASGVFLFDEAAPVWVSSEGGLLSSRSVVSLVHAPGPVAPAVTTKIKQKNSDAASKNPAARNPPDNEDMGASGSNTVNGHMNDSELSAAGFTETLSLTASVGWSFISPDEALRLSSPRSKRAAVEGREIAKARQRRSELEASDRALGHTIKIGSVPDELSGLTAPLTLKQVDTRTGAILRPGLSSQRDPTPQWFDLHRNRLRRHAPVMPLHRIKGGSPEVGPTSRRGEGGARSPTAATHAAETPPIMEEVEVGDDSPERLLRATDNTYDGLGIEEVDDEPDSKHILSGGALECAAKDPDEMTNEQLSRPPSAAPSRHSSSYPYQERDALGAHTKRGPHHSVLSYSPTTFLAPSPPTAPRTGGQPNSLPGDGELFEFRYRAVEATIQEQQERYSSPKDVHRRRMEKIRAGLAAPVYPPAAAPKSTTKDTSGSHPTPPQRTSHHRGANGNSVLPQGTDGTNVLTQASADRNARLLRKKSSMGSLFARSGSFMLSGRERGSTAGDSEDGFGSGGDAVVELHTHHRKLQAQHAHHPVVISPTRRKARIVAVEPHIGGLLFDQDLLRVIAFDPAHSPSSSPQQSRAASPSSLPSRKDGRGAVAPPAFYGEIGGGGVAGGGSSSSYFKVGDVVLYNRQYDFTEDGRYCQHNLYNSGGTSLTAVERLVGDAFNATSAEEGVPQEATGSVSQQYVSNGGDTDNRNDHALERSALEMPTSTASVRNMDLYDLSRMDPSVSEVNTLAVRLLLVSSKGHNNNNNNNNTVVVPPTADIATPVDDGGETLCTTFVAWVPSSRQAKQTHARNAGSSLAVGCGAAAVPLSFSQLVSSASGTTPSSALVGVTGGTRIELTKHDLEGCYRTLLAGNIAATAEEGNDRFGSGSSPPYTRDTLSAALGLLPPAIQIQLECDLVRQLNDLRMIKTTTTADAGASHVPSHPLLPPKQVSTLLPARVVGAGLEYFDSLHRLKVERFSETRASLLTRLQHYVNGGRDIEEESDGSGRSKTEVLAPTAGNARDAEIKRRAAASLHKVILDQMKAEQQAEGIDHHHLFLPYSERPFTKDEEDDEESDIGGFDTPTYLRSSLASATPFDIASFSANNMEVGASFTPPASFSAHPTYKMRRLSMAESTTGEEKRKSLRLLLKNDKAVSATANAPDLGSGTPASHPGLSRNSSASRHFGGGLPGSYPVRIGSGLSPRLFTVPPSSTGRVGSSSANSDGGSHPRQSTAELQPSILAAQARLLNAPHRDGDSEGVYSNPFGTSNGLAELLLVHTQLNPYAVAQPASAPSTGPHHPTGGTAVPKPPPRKSIFDNTPQPRISPHALALFQQTFVGGLPRLKTAGGAPSHPRTAR